MTRPNFVFLMTDTQGANVIGCYGRPELQTPNLDRLAAQGVRFERAYTTCPVCTPARGAIFTGLYPHLNGAWANSLPLGDSFKTMGQRFRDSGYQTAYAGKWHLAGHDYFDTGICPDGWDERTWYDGKRYLDDLTDAQVALWRTGLRSVEALRAHNITPEFTWGHRVSDRGIRFLQEQAEERPFLLVLSYDEPHGPETCPPEFVERFADYDWPIGPNAHDDLSGKPAMHRQLAEAHGRRYEGGTGRWPFYFGCNSYVDCEIGRVLEAIDAHARENTYVIFTSDHGSFLGAHGLMGKGLAMYEESARIPLIVRSPGGANAGKVDPTPVSHVDLMPTMLEAAGLDVPPILEGESLMPHLTGPHTDAQRDVFIEWHRFEIDHDSPGGFFLVRCTVSGDWKLVINLTDTDELYNLSDDPHEMVNRISDASCAAVREQLFEKLIRRMYDGRDPFRGPGWLERPWRQTKGMEGVVDKAHRGRPDDGYYPPYLHYDTGRPLLSRD